MFFEGEENESTLQSGSGQAEVKSQTPKTALDWTGLDSTYRVFISIHFGGETLLSSTKPGMLVAVIISQYWLFLFLYYFWARRYRLKRWFSSRKRCWIQNKSRDKKTIIRRGTTSIARPQQKSHNRQPTRRGTTSVKAHFRGSLRDNIQLSFTTDGIRLVETRYLYCWKDLLYLFRYACMVEHGKVSSATYQY